MAIVAWSGQTMALKIVRHMRKSAMKSKKEQPFFFVLFLRRECRRALSSVKEKREEKKKLGLAGQRESNQFRLRRIGLQALAY